MSVRASNHFVTEFFSAVKATPFDEYNKVRQVLKAAGVIRQRVIDDIDGEVFVEVNGVGFDEHYTKLIDEAVDVPYLSDSEQYCYELRQAEIHPVYTRALNSYTFDYLEESPLDERYESMLWSLMSALEDCLSPTFEPKFFLERVNTYARKALCAAVAAGRLKKVFRKNGKLYFVRTVRKVKNNVRAIHNERVFAQPLADALAGVRPCNPPCPYCK